MRFGGHGYFGLSSFGEPVSITQVIHESLNAQMGSGYNVEQTSLIYLQNLAAAKLLAGAWSLNRRLANQGNPLTLTTLLKKAERDEYKLPIDPDLTDTQRRQRIADIEARRGEVSDYQFVTDNVQALLGAAFGAIEFTDYAHATITVPDGSYPWGVVSPGAPWSNSQLHILLYTVKPAGWSEGQYYAAVGKVSPFLDAVTPSWCTYDWYRQPDTGTPINVVGGPSHGGFYLDNEHNLDNNVFDV